MWSPVSRYSSPHNSGGCCFIKEQCRACECCKHQRLLEILDRALKPFYQQGAGGKI